MAPDLNTSHVIFYQRRIKLPPFLVEFKYISCYLLSGKGYGGFEQ